MDFPFSLDPLVSSVGPGSHHDVSLPGAPGPGGHEALMQVWSWSRVEHLRSRQVQDQVWGAAVDAMGAASAKAQSLGAVITSHTKFARGSDLIYLHITPSLRRVNAMLRTGRKRLFIRDEVGTIVEIEPSCVLDFYVHESCQRTGIGKQLFDFMLQVEGGQSPARYGYDRPSHKLLAFLSKHYALSTYVPQNNNFVVFRKYFNTAAGSSSSTGFKRTNRAGGMGQQQPHDQVVLNPRALPAAGTRTHSHPSSMAVSVPRLGSAAAEAVPSPRLRDGAVPPRDQINQQGGPVSRHMAMEARGARGGMGGGSPEQQRYQQPGPDQYSAFAALQASPPAGRAAFRYDDDGGDDGASMQQLRFGSERDLAEQDAAYAARDGSFNPRASGSGSRPGSGRSGSQGQGGGYASSSSAAYGGAAAPASSYGGGFGSYGGSGGGSGSGYDDRSLSQHRRGTPPDAMGGSRLARAGNNVLQTGGSGGGGGGGGSQPQQRELPVSQRHQHNILTGFLPGENPLTNARGGVPANFLPDNIGSGLPAQAALPSELPFERKVARSGVAARPLAAPSAGQAKFSAAVAAREAELARKESALASASAQKFQIPYRQPDAWDSQWSRSASQQRVHMRLDGGGPPDAVPLQSEQNARFANPRTSPLVGGGASEYQLPSHVYANGIPARSNFAYGSRK